MAKPLFKSKDRNACHAKLAELLKDDPALTAECREGEWFTVWDGPFTPNDTLDLAAVEELPILGSK